MAKKLSAILEAETPERRAETITKAIEPNSDVDKLVAEINRLEAVIRDKERIISNLEAANELISHELSQVRNK